MNGIAGIADNIDVNALKQRHKMGFVFIAVPRERVLISLGSNKTVCAGYRNECVGRWYVHARGLALARRGVFSGFFLQLLFGDLLHFTFRVHQYFKVADNLVLLAL